MSSPSSIVAIDVGNSRIKLGQFATLGRATPSGLPEPTATLAIASPYDFSPLEEWLAANVPSGTPFVTGSVNRAGAQQLHEFLQERSAGPWRELAQADFPIANLTEEPSAVGIDRLAAAVAANAIRREQTPAIVIDFGTAITVDLVNGDGQFEGGAILPGVALSARALHEGTDALPLLADRFDGKSPPSVGKSTTAAIASGLYWGTIGALRELVARQSDGIATSPQVFVTGSTAPDVARLLSAPDRTVRYFPHLVLAGLALAAEL